MTASNHDWFVHSILFWNFLKQVQKDVEKARHEPIEVSEDENEGEEDEEEEEEEDN
jgi:hypothetical protein